MLAAACVRHATGIGVHDVGMLFHAGDLTECFQHTACVLALLCGKGSVAACVCRTALCIDTASHSAQQSACMLAISLRSA
jgi:hypothetical protein